MKLIVGLGNPGRVYRDSRHNVGFSIIKTLGRIYKIPLKRDSHTFSLSGKGRIEGRNAMLALPLTFMNLSGVAVGALVRKYKIDLRNLLVVCDDLDLRPGAMKIKSSGSSGGHRGLESIIDSLGTQEFCRLRIGIGRPLNKNIDAARYVLSSFARKEKEEVKETIERARDCCRVWLTKGAAESMNIFNRGC